MSPTEAIVIRSALLSGIAAAAGWAGCAIGIGEGTTGSVGGAVAQPARAANATTPKRAANLVTEADAKHIDLRAAKATAQDIEFVEVVRGSYANAVIGFVIDRDALYL